VTYTTEMYLRAAEIVERAQNNNAIRPSKTFASAMPLAYRAASADPEHPVHKALLNLLPFVVPDADYSRS